MTLVNLYFPRPSVQESPMCISSDLCFCEGTTSSVSAEGASKLKVYGAV